MIQINGQTCMYLNGAMNNDVLLDIPRVWNRMGFHDGIAYTGKWLLRFAIVEHTKMRIASSHEWEWVSGLRIGNKPAAGHSDCDLYDRICITVS